jgi:lysylphosphatidylglycerol synthetase-like protein (DUF2156 family)
VRQLVALYVVVALGTLVALAVLAGTAPRLATDEAWGHALIVAVFAVVLPLRTRAAARGSVSGLRALTIIGVVLLVVNVVEAALPGVDARGDGRHRGDDAGPRDPVAAGAARRRPVAVGLTGRAE